jgi:spore coat polysaccharide biosynthesis protein SpsF (cytidylyltransferase family)
MRTVAVIQARMSSSRFPGKVLMPLEGRPMIGFMLDRVRRARHLDAIVVATSEDPSDDELARCVESLGFACHRGSLNDVLARFEGAARVAGADVVVRLTGDCPLMEPDLIDRVVAHLHDSGADYVSNIAPPTYPDGLDVETFTMAALLRAAAEAVLPSDREHVTPYVRRTENGFRLDNLRGLADLSHLRWTVDYPDDLRFVAALLDAAGGADPLQADRFDFYRAIERNPALLAINHHERNEGYALSLAAEAAT